MPRCFSVEITRPVKGERKPVRTIMVIEALAVTEAVEIALEKLQVRLSDVIRIVACPEARREAKHDTTTTPRA